MLKNKICNGCGKNKPSKNTISSVKNEHPTAHKAQKRIKAQVNFVFVNSNAEADLCEDCQRLIISGMANGGMWR